MALVRPTPKIDLTEHYRHLLTCPELIDTRDHLPLFHSLPGHILEIGCDCGNSTTAFLSGEAESVTSIDINPICESNFPEAKNWRFVCADSNKQETYDKVCSQKYDVLFVDGDHTYEGASLDLIAYSRLVVGGGLILVHDVLAHDTFPGVFRAFVKFTPNIFGHTCAKYILPGSYGLGVIEL